MRRLDQRRRREGKGLEARTQPIWDGGGVGDLGESYVVFL